MLYGRAGYLYSLLWVEKQLGPGSINEAVVKVLRVRSRSAAACREGVFLAAAPGFRALVFLGNCSACKYHRPSLGRLLRTSLPLATLHHYLPLAVFTPFLPHLNCIPRPALPPTPAPYRSPPLPGRGGSPAASGHGRGPCV